MGGCGCVLPGDLEVLPFVLSGQEDMQQTQVGAFGTEIDHLYSYLKIVLVLFKPAETE